MPDAVIVEYARTAFGKAGKGALHAERSDDLRGTAVAGVLSRLPQLDPAEIVDVYWGCSLPHRTQGYNIARQVALLGGLPATVPGVTLARSCGSSISGLRAAAPAIQAGDGDAYLIGGCDSLSTCLPWNSSPDDENPRVAGAYFSLFDPPPHGAHRH